MLLDFVQMIYWLALASWFGLVLFNAMATPSIFRTVQEADPTLPTVLSVNLDSQHGVLLAMSIVSNIMRRLAAVQLLCAIGLAVALVVQWVMGGGSGQVVVMTAIRSALFLAAVGMLFYGWRVIWPRAAAQRKLYIDNADNPEQAEAARDQLTRLQRESDFVQMAMAAALLALILFSVNLPRPVVERILTQ